MSKYNMYIEDVSVEAVFNKLGGVDGARRLLRNELILSESPKKWREEDGVIYFSVTSDGTTGPKWIRRFSGNVNVAPKANSLLRSPDFMPTYGVTTEVAVLKGMLFGDSGCVTQEILAEANQRKLIVPNAELACLIRLKFTDKEIEAMALMNILAMHEPINDLDNIPRRLSARPSVDGPRLDAYSDEYGNRWNCAGGFAFVVSQTVPQN